MTNNQTTTFYYDADGNRLLTIQPDGVKVYTPFPEFEETVDGSAVTKRSFYYLAGQLIAARVDGPAANDDVYTYAYADHLGSIVAWSWTGGTPPVNGYLSRYEPFGGYRTRPDVAVNPAISSRGFTGHRGNNAGEQDIQNLNLIYMNARYYMPEVGRFISADTIVPNPQNPQSYNRYSYVRNNPVHFTDPTGHRECLEPDGGCQPYTPPWVQAANDYRAGRDIAFGPDGTPAPQTYGNFNVGPINVMFSDEILDIYTEASVGGYFLVLGGGTSQVFSYADPNFGGATSSEVGQGIGIEVMGVGFEFKKAISASSDGTVAMEYYFTGTILGAGDGLSFHVDSVIIRPSEQLSQVLAQGGEDVWLELFDYVYSSGVVSVDMNFLGTVPRHDSFDYDGIVPVHLVTTGSLDN